MPNDLENLVEMVYRETGFRPTRAVLELDGIRYGTRMRVIDDEDEDDATGPFAGEEGYAIIEIVGAKKYHNEQARLYFLADDMDCPMPMTVDNLEEI
jgi:hypothetical protein